MSPSKALAAQSLVGRLEASAVLPSYEPAAAAAPTRPVSSTTHSSGHPHTILDRLLKVI
jgi:hypothetical protein